MLVAVAEASLVGDPVGTAILVLQEQRCRLVSGVSQVRLTLQQVSSTQLKLHV